MPNSAALEYRRQLSESLPPITLEMMQKMVEEKRQEQERFTSLFRRT